MGMEQLLSRQENMNLYPNTALNLSLLKWKPAISTSWKTESRDSLVYFNFTEKRIFSLALLFHIN